MRVFVGDQEKRSLSAPPCTLKSCRGCSLGDFAGSRVLFLRKQVKDLWVQVFLRELIVGVVPPSYLAGSIIVKILHSIEGGDVEQVCSNLETVLPYLRLLISLSLSLVFYILHVLIVHIYYTLDIFLCLIDIYAWDC